MTLACHCKALIRDIVNHRSAEIMTQHQYGMFAIFLYTTCRRPQRESVGTGTNSYNPAHMKTMLYHGPYIHNPLPATNTHSLDRHLSYRHTITTDHFACQWVRAQRPSEQQYVRLGSVHLIVSPATRLLDAQAAPFGLGEEAERLGKRLGQLARKNDVPAERKHRTAVRAVSIREREGGRVVV